MSKFDFNNSSDMGNASYCFYHLEILAQILNL